MERLTITLTQDLATRVKEAVEGGQYGSVSEVMRQALRDWEMAEARRHAELASLRADIQVGLDDVAAGRVEPFSVAAIVKAGKRIAAKKR
ncbi:MAG: type II toxin-antitoxin system ParD family antitoxin [Hyphomicrobium aestuarii]|nr:type II toxin-antitoxin system ParD family antitoxin [Hyphomicrobium aestuarii]